MLAKAGADQSIDAGSDLVRHLDVLTRFVERARQVADPAEHVVTLILRSATSLPAQALLAMGEDLLAAGISGRLILARLDPVDQLRRLAGLLGEMNRSGASAEILRWAKNPRLLDAHEQAIYGGASCWVGDAMRRDASRRNALSLFSEAAPGSTRLAEMAFSALWHACERVPQWRLSGASRSQDAACFDPTQASDSFEAALLRPSVQAWPLIRH
jgi:hypothetical protein